MSDWIGVFIAFGYLAVIAVAGLPGLGLVALHIAILALTTRRLSHGEQ